jgi:hypothetical protein
MTIQYRSDFGKQTDLPLLHQVTSLHNKGTSTLTLQDVPTNLKHTYSLENKSPRTTSSYIHRTTKGAQTLTISLKTVSDRLDTNIFVLGKQILLPTHQLHIRGIVHTNNYILATTGAHYRHHHETSRITLDKLTMTHLFSTYIQHVPSCKPFGTPSPPP